MSLVRPTLEQCIDAADHSWLIVNETLDGQGIQWQNWWCQKCGVVTQVQLGEDGSPIAVMNEDDTPYLLVPKVLKITIL